MDRMVPVVLLLNPDLDFSPTCMLSSLALPWISQLGIFISLPWTGELMFVFIPGIDR